MTLTNSAPETTATGGLLGDFLTEPELARELGVCQMTVRRWRAVGDAPPTTRLGRRILYRRDAVADWLKSRQIELEVL